MTPKKKKSDEEVIAEGPSDSPKEDTARVHQIIEVVEVVEPDEDIVTPDEEPKHEKKIEHETHHVSPVEDVPEASDSSIDEPQKEEKVSKYAFEHADENVQEESSIQPEVEITENNTEEQQKTTVQSLFTQKEPTVLPEISMHMHEKRSGKGIITWAIIMIVAALTIGGGLMIVTRGVRQTSMTAKPTPTPTIAETPTPTPSPVLIAKDKLKIQVLNGGGKPGAASKMKEALKAKGYSVSATGNTDEYSYTKTEIHGKADKAGNVDQLQSDLKASYTIGVASADLSPDNAADIQVIVGKE